MGKVTVELTGDELKLLKALDRVVKKERELGAAAADTGKKSAKGSKEATTGFAGLQGQLEKTFGAGGLKMISTFATGLVGAGGIAGGIAMIRKEIENLYAVQREAASAQITANVGWQNLIRNTGSISSADQARMLKAVPGISSKTGVGEGVISNAMASGISASAGNVNATLQAVEQASIYLADMPELIEGFAGSLLDMISITGSEDALLNQGFLQTVGGLSRITDPTKSAKHGAVAMTGMVKNQFTAQEAAALFAATTTTTKDIEGATSATSDIALAAQLREFFDKEGLTKKYGAMSLDPMLEMMYASPNLGKKFMAGASFEKKTSAQMEELILNRDSETARQYRANLGSLGTPESQRALAQKSIEARMLSPYERNAAIKRTLDQAIEAEQLGNIEGGIEATVREGLKEYRKASGISATEQDIDKYFELGRSAEDVPGLLRREAIRTRQPAVVSAGMGGMGTVIPASAKELNQADLADIIADKLDKLLDATKEQTEAVKETGGKKVVNRNANS